MREQNEPKLRSVQVRALLIFRDIMKIQNKAFENIKKEINVLINERAKSKDLDLETAQFLQNVYLRQKTKTEEEKKEEKLSEHVENVVEYAVGNAIRKKFGILKNDKSERVVLILSENGDLYRQGVSKDKRCYKLDESKLRLTIIHFLREQEDPVSGQDIASALGTSYGSITDAIGRINAISRDKLGLPKKQELIISGNSGGYKLNPTYVIIEG